MRVFPIVLFALLLAAAGGCVELIAAGLPPIVAIHFDGAGNANGFATGADCREFMLAITLGAPAFVALLTVLVPRSVPPSMVNIPNKAYWLAPERARGSIAFLCEQGIWFASILLAFLIAVDWLLAKANAVQPPLFPTRQFMACLFLLFAAIGVWALRMFQRFSLPR